MTTRRVSRRLGHQWPWACLCLARALHHSAGLDDAVKLEAAVLVDGRHEVDGGVDRLGVGHARRVEGHGGRAHFWRVCGWVVVQCGCQVGGVGVTFTGGGLDAVKCRSEGLYVCVCVFVCVFVCVCIRVYVYGTGHGGAEVEGVEYIPSVIGG